MKPLNWTAFVTDGWVGTDDEGKERAFIMSETVKYERTGQVDTLWHASLVGTSLEPVFPTISHAIEWVNASLGIRLNTGIKPNPVSNDNAN